MPRRSQVYRARCAACDSPMHKSCVSCGRIFCQQHLVRPAMLCTGCVERCSTEGCELIGSQNCFRCGRPLCASHRRKKSRCEACESEYGKDRRVVAYKRELRTSPPGSSSSTFLPAFIGLWLVAPLFGWLSTASMIFFGGLLLAGLGAHWWWTRSTPERGLAAARRRFLGEQKLP